MFLHIGGSEIVFNRELIGIFNLDLPEGGHNKHFLERASVKNLDLLSGSGRHKSFIVTDKNVYISPISPLTLSRRRNTTR